MSEIASRVAEIERLGLARELRTVSGSQGPHVRLDGQKVLLLCSNNYLGLADHPRVREAAAEAAMHYGAGAGASRLVSGSMSIHRELEERLATFEGSEDCVLFGSGYLANLGTICAFAGPGDTVFSDALNHASIVDGCRTSRARVVVYRHLDHEHLHHCLRHAGDGHRLIVTDSVFSMDGDVAPLQEIARLAREHDARLIVDEAHATGTLGPGGRGAVAEAGLGSEVDAIVGTLSKALGSYGAYVCASRETIRYLVNVARPLIYSTAPPPPAVAGALAALQLIEESPNRVAQLHESARALRRALACEGFRVRESTMHIVPLVVGDEHAVMRVSELALEHGVFAQGIRPPTVPPGTSRLRLAAMASHSHEDLRAGATTLSQAARELGLDPSKIGEPGMRQSTTQPSAGEAQNIGMNAGEIDGMHRSTVEVAHGDSATHHAA